MGLKMSVLCHGREMKYFSVGNSSNRFLFCFDREPYFIGSVLQSNFLKIRMDF